MTLHAVSATAELLVYKVEGEHLCAVDVETLCEEMVDAFRSVLIVLPRGPTDDENYAHFIERTRSCSYKPPFCAPLPPFDNIKVPASYTSRILRSSYYLCTHKTS